MQNVKRVLVFLGLVFGVSGAWALPQSPMQVTDDTEIYQNLSEIRASKKGQMQFHQDLTRLMTIESRFHEKLPRAKSTKSRRL